MMNFALFGGTLIVGVDEELRRVYVGQRWKGIYFDEPPEAVDEAIDQWTRSTSHVVISKPDLAMLELKTEENDDRQVRAP